MINSWYELNENHRGCLVSNGDKGSYELFYQANIHVILVDAHGCQLVIGKDYPTIDAAKDEANFYDNTPLEKCTECKCSFTPLPVAIFKDINGVVYCRGCGRSYGDW